MRRTSCVLPLTLEHALLEESLTDPAASLDSCRSTFCRLLANSEQQTALLEALLTLASSERGLEIRTPVELSSLTRAALDSAHVDIGRRDLTLTTRVEETSTTGDPALMERLVANLLDNAIRHNVPHGSLHVSTSTDEGRAVLVVSNTGPIIPPDQLDRIQEPFQRAGTPRTSSDGHHGLGLSIVRAITTAHHATLTLTPWPAGGLTVEVQFG